MVSDLLCDNWIGYEFDEIVYGVYGRVDALEPLDLLADGQGIVGERRVVVVIGRTAVHGSVTLRTHHRVDENGARTDADGTKSQDETSAVRLH